MHPSLVIIVIIKVMLVSFHELEMVELEGGAVLGGSNNNKNTNIKIAPNRTLHVSSGVFRLKCRSNRPSETDQLSK
jgi:hypothetical protein